jgi:hypothetical protein
MNGPLVTRATLASRERVVDTVVTAFAADPAFRFFFPDSASFVAHATTFARHLFDRRVDRGTIWIIDEGMWSRCGTSRQVMSCPATTRRLPAFLETTNPNNIGLYRKAGWEIRESITVDSLAIWVMSWLGLQDASSP